METWKVAPLAGAWIEIDIDIFDRAKEVVAPLAGAWIEIEHDVRKQAAGKVAPLAGAWIEIFLALPL